MSDSDAQHAKTERTAINTTEGSTYFICELPTFCPRCRRNSIPMILGNAAMDYYDEGGEFRFDLPLFCTACNGAFIGQYFGLDDTMSDHPLTDLEFLGTVPAAERETIVAFALANISPQFAKVYDEAVAAEKAGLEDLSGAGYRRALEFLVKDYLIYRNPAEKETYIKTTLSNCIKHHVKMPEIEEIAGEAVSIGNDYVHFEKYTKREVHELRGLIKLVWRWIELREELHIETERIARLKSIKIAEEAEGAIETPFD
jgi:hypothetical protein